LRQGFDIGRQTARIALPAFMVAALLAGCTDRTEEIARQLETLRQELAQLKAASANSAVQLEDLQNRILLLQDQVESHQLLLSRTPAPTPQLPVVKLSPRYAAAGTPAPEPRPSSVSPEPIPEVRFQELTETGLVVDMTGPRDPAPVRPATVPGPGPDRARKAFDSRPVELYKQGFELLEKKRHQEAIAHFERFLEQYPSHDYADNAMYWIAEAWYDVQDFRKAFECFEKVVTLYPTGNKVPDALLKSALCLANAGDPGGAQEVIARLLEHYPATRAAEIGREKLKTLQQEQVRQ